MEDEILHTKKDPKAELSGIGAKLVKATQHTFAAKKMCEKANRLLLDVQSEVAALHTGMAQNEEKPPT